MRVVVRAIRLRLPLYALDGIHPVRENALISIQLSLEFFTGG